MNNVNTTTLAKAGTVAAVLGGAIAYAVPFVGAILAGLGIAAGLFGMGAIEMRKRAY